jgi:hypothetical protein
MDFVRFYVSVIREAFRHSVDLAQAFIFIILIVAGSIAAGNPKAKLMLEHLELGGWKTAALVLGGIIGIRLIMAPYWLWKEAASRTVTHPEKSIDYKLTVSRIFSRNDKKKNAIQIVFVLNNASYFHALQYEVEDVYAEVDGKTFEGEIIWTNRGQIIPPTKEYNFDYPWIFLKTKKWISPGTLGHASITFKYGAAGQPFSRRKKFAAPIIFERDHVRFNPTEDTEEAA